MSDKIQAIRGMHDILPDQVPIWQFLEQTIRDLLMEYGYLEIRMPLVEKTELFHRSIGAVTDIVEKEMYTFEDRNGDSLTLRPEGTAGCVRAAIENGMLRNQVQRLWYMGPMFRHERPQKGRYRQFQQIGVEIFGIPGPDIDAEMIIMLKRLWARLGLEGIRLEINTLGTDMERAVYREKLVDFLSANPDLLDDDSQRRLETNPLRILDSKNPDMQDLIRSAPVLGDYLDRESREHFDKLLGYLDAAGVEYTVNPRLVRGLDYYCKTVFEWISDRLGAQGTVCAGGRFDNLVEHLGGKPTPAAGYAIGLNRIVDLLVDAGAAPVDNAPHAYLVMMGEAAQLAGVKLSEHLRDHIPGLRLLLNCGEGSFKSQFRRADRSGAQLALILGEDEVTRNRIGVKSLREEGQQQSFTTEQLVEYLNNRVRC